MKLRENIKIAVEGIKKNWRKSKLVCRKTLIHINKGNPLFPQVITIGDVID